MLNGVSILRGANFIVCKSCIPWLKYDRIFQVKLLYRYITHSEVSSSPHLRLGRGFLPTLL